MGNEKLPDFVPIHSHVRAAEEGGREEGEASVHACGDENNGNSLVGRNWYLLLLN